MTSTTHDERLVPTPGERSGPGGPGELDGGDPEEGPPRRRPRLFTTLAVIAGGLALAAGAWYVSQALIKPGGQSSGELPLLVADTSPVKVRPEDPGGAEIPNRDKYVYKSLEGEPSEAPVEQLLPAPEEPMAKPVDTGPPLEPLANVALEAMWAKPAPKAEPPGQAAPTAEPPASSVEREILTPPEPPPAEGAAAGAGTSSADGAPVPVAEAPARAPAESASADNAALGAVEPAAGGIWIQLAALRDESAIEAEWARLVKRHPAVLGTLERRVERVDLGAKGIWYRVQAGAFSDRPSADAACRTLLGQGGSCKVVKP